MNYSQALKLSESKQIQTLFSQLYGNDADILSKQNKRYEQLIKTFGKRFNETDVHIFSSPGRSEIGGNHTDHNLGKVLASSIQLDCIGVVAPTDTNNICINDSTYNEDYTVDILSTQRIKNEKGSIALVRGIIEGFKRAGYKVGGFNGCFSSHVIAAAGVSSSASFEMMICIILNTLYNGGTIPVEQFASIGQFAENMYWDKASGQLDQMACAVGGLISIDFKNPENPLVEKIAFDFAKEQYRLIIVNTGKSHADLSQEYSSIPKEMKSVAQYFGQNVLCKITLDELIKKLPDVRAQCGDRAVMRAIHFIEENNRVDQEVAALKANNFTLFLKLIIESGNSSWKYLQNTYVTNHPQEQSIPVCLALTENFIHTQGKGACRIHGGGFAGVIQVFLPENLVQSYTQLMNTALGVTDGMQSPVYVMSIRPFGVIEIC